MGRGATMAWVVRAGAREDRGTPGAADFLRRVADEVGEFASPADALEGLLARGGWMPHPRRSLVVIDSRGSQEIWWSWIHVLAHLGLGPLILLVDRTDAGLLAAAERAGVSRCLEARHLSRHPGLLVRSARRALEPDGRLATVGLPA